MSSKLWLIRHGAAGAAAVDRDRALTDIGRKEVEALREELRSLEAIPDRILHSGYRRARETAEILASLGTGVPLEHSAISPEDDPEILIAEMSEFGGTTMIVSHLPFLPHLCQELLAATSDLLHFATGTAVMLEPLDAATGRRSWQVAWQINGREALLRSSR